MGKKVLLQGVSLSKLADGYAGKAIDSGLRRITEDIADRGHDGKARTLTIKITFEPDDKGRCEVDVDVGVKLPGYRPPKTLTKYDQRAGALSFSPDAADNPDQSAIPGAGVDDETE